MNILKINDYIDIFVLFLLHKMLSYLCHGTCIIFYYSLSFYVLYLSIRKEERGLNIPPHEKI